MTTAVAEPEKTSTASVSPEANAKPAATPSAAPSAPATDAKADAPAAGKPDKPEAAVLKPTIAKPETPSVYDLKLPADAKLDDAYVSELKAHAAKHAYSPEQAQAQLEREVALRAGMETERAKAHADATERDWAELQADKVLGGANLDKTFAAANLALANYAPPGLADWIVANGLQHNLKVMQFLANVAKPLGETPLVTDGKPPVKEKTVADRWLKHPDSIAAAEAERNRSN